MKTNKFQAIMLASALLGTTIVPLSTALPAVTQAAPSSAYTKANAQADAYVKAVQRAYASISLERLKQTTVWKEVSLQSVMNAYANVAKAKATLRDKKQIAAIEKKVNQVAAKRSDIASFNAIMVVYKDVHQQATRLRTGSLTPELAKAYPAYTARLQTLKSLVKKQTPVARKAVLEAKLLPSLPALSADRKQGLETLYAILMLPAFHSYETMTEEALDTYTAQIEEGLLRLSNKEDQAQLTKAYEDLRTNGYKGFTTTFVGKEIKEYQNVANFPKLPNSDPDYIELDPNYVASTDFDTTGIDPAGKVNEAVKLAKKWESKGFTLESYDARTNTMKLMYKDGNSTVGISFTQGNTDVQYTYGFTITEDKKLFETYLDILEEMAKFRGDYKMFPKEWRMYLTKFSKFEKVNGKYGYTFIDPKTKTKIQLRDSAIQFNPYGSY